MKKAILMAALFLSASAFAAEDEPKKCHTEIERASNPFLEILTIPFKAVAAFSHLPRCLIDHFPVNEDQ